MSNTTGKLLLRRAENTAADLFTVQRLIASSARWMHNLGNHAWPIEGFPPERIIPGMIAGEVWILHDGPDAVATITLDQNPEQEFTAPAAVLADVPAMLPYSWIGHRLAADRGRPGNGYGELLVNWSVDWAARHGGYWRLTNVARQADRLQGWYRRLGFRKLALVLTTRTPEGAPRRSGYLMWRETEPMPEVYERLVEVS